MKRCLITIIVALASLLTVTCGGAIKPDTPTVPISFITGSVVKGPVEGAQIRLFFFDDAGAEVEITAVNTPVYTDANGDFVFTVNGTSLMGISTPLIVRTEGGTMYGAAAPTLEAVIDDPVPLTYDQVNVSTSLSAASSVAAGLVRSYALDIGAAPSLAKAREYIILVEEQFRVDLSTDPEDPESTPAMFNHCVDQNLDLILNPANNPAVDELIAYFVSNLRSSTGKLDNLMESPGMPGVDTSASFSPFGAGLLDGIFPSGPSSLQFMVLSSDRKYIENDGNDSATVIAALMDAAGMHTANLEDVELGVVSGPGNLVSSGKSYGSGEVSGSLTSTATGESLLQAVYPLFNGNDITLQITIPSVDLVTDTDGDGFSDGDETLGWDIAIDTLGYGSDAGGSLLVIRHVSSDPDMADTDADGLNDYLEYIVRTDPYSPDTDGDGLTDAEEWYRWISSPTSVDTDGDARGPSHNLSPKAELFDGNELFLLATSPTLADTDGDGWTDFEEFDHPSRSPRVADLPRLELTIEDEVDVRLDVEYAEEEGQTSEYGTELTKSTTQATSRYDSKTVGHSLMVGAEYKYGLLGGTSLTTEYTFKTEQQVAFTSESSKTAQTAYSTYNTEARTRTETAASGSLSMGIRLKNTGNITYTITQLGITARQWHPGTSDPWFPDSPGSFTTIATLSPALGGGLTLAPGSTSPVLQVSVSDVNADRIKGLLARPDSLHLEPAYYELENAEGLNFAYMEEITGPRTALVFLDYGDGRTEEYRVATNMDRNSDGSLAGISLGEVMNEVLNIPYETRPRQFLEPSSLTNERVLFSVRDLATNAADLDRAFWTVILPQSASGSVWLDFEDVTVHGGEQVLMVYVRDEDGDGLYAAEEQHFRTDETSVDLDGDGLTDAQEVRGGWDVVLPGVTYFTTSDPTEADQDADGLDDLAEMTEGTDPSLPDTDRDGLEDGYDPHPLHPARVLHVKEGGSPVGDGLTWLTAMGSLTDALLEAKSGNSTLLIADDDVAEVWVAAGRYTPSDTGDRTVSFELSPNISVFGGFSGTETKLAQRIDNPLAFVTTLSGDLLNNDAESYADDPATFDDNSLHVIQAGDSVDGNTVLDGFYIIGGNADDTSSDEGSYGGGLLSSGTPALKNLFFRTNIANTGGGVYTAPSMSDGRKMNVTDCLFVRNEAIYSETTGGGTGGGMHFSGPGASLDLDSCEFSENRSWGSAGLQLGPDLTANISRCVFDRNDAQQWIVPYQQGIGGGAGVGDGSKVRFDLCRFTRNKATYGGGMSSGLDIQIQVNQTVFWENEATTPAAENYGGGGAIYTRGGSYWIVNSTIANNRAIDPDSTWSGVEFGRPGGIWFNGTGSHKIENSIVYGNTYTSSWSDTYPDIGGQQIRLNTASTLTARTSDIQGLSLLGLSGFGNIDADPSFIDDVAGNMNLRTVSPCIDAGSNYVDYEPMTPGFQLLPATDLNGVLRIVDGDGDGNVFVDMGPYEYQPE